MVAIELLKMVHLRADVSYSCVFVHITQTSWVFSPLHLGMQALRSSIPSSPTFATLRSMQLTLKNLLKMSERSILTDLANLSPHQIHVLNSVIVVVSVLSALGAGWIIVSFLILRSLRTFRHQLILYVSFPLTLVLPHLSSMQRTRNQRFLYGHKFHEQRCKELSQSKYRRSFRENFLQFQWVYDTGICSLDRLLGPHHRGVDLSDSDKS